MVIRSFSTFNFEFPLEERITNKMSATISTEPTMIAIFLGVKRFLLRGMSINNLVSAYITIKIVPQI